MGAAQTAPTLAAAAETELDLVAICTPPSSHAPLALEAMALGMDVVLASLLTGWRGQWDVEGGGPTMGHGIHQFDLLLHLWGPWQEVTAFAGKLARRTETEDASPPPSCGSSHVR